MELHISSIYLGEVRRGWSIVCKCREPYWGDSRKPFVRVMAIPFKTGGKKDVTVQDIGLIAAVSSSTCLFST
jgi:hypothetical protein